MSILEAGLLTNFQKGIKLKSPELEIRKKAFGDNEKPPIILKSFCFY